MDSQTNNELEYSTLSLIGLFIVAALSSIALSCFYTYLLLAAVLMLAFLIALFP